VIEDWAGKTLLTIGHSTRSFEDFVALLQGAGATILADIRTVPRSRRNPQFNAEAMAAALPPLGVRYRHVPALGGLRRARKDSPNGGWRNESFRGYADYMLTEQFEAGLEELHALMADGTVAVMCAEAVPWRCHRSLLADVLTVRGAQVRHIVGADAPHPHRLTSFAVAENGRVTYPPVQQDAFPGGDAT
jgi:uncharacterized protein (DUF488 family)